MNGLTTSSHTLLGVWLLIHAIEISHRRQAIIWKYGQWVNVLSILGWLCICWHTISSWYVFHNSLLTIAMTYTKPYHQQTLPPSKTRVRVPWSGLVTSVLIVPNKLWCLSNEWWYIPLWTGDDIIAVNTTNASLGCMYFTVAMALMLQWSHWATEDHILQPNMIYDL